MPLGKFKRKLGDVAGIAGEAAKSVGGVAADKAAAAGGFVVGKAVAGKELAAQAGMEAKLRFYNPLFREDYFDTEFDRPDLVVIVDGDERKGIDVCEGAIGWLSKHKGTELLHMYGEFVEESGLDFYPQPQYGAVYQVDTYDSNRFIDLSRLFDVAHKDKITELRNVAYDLGARYCKVESYESRKEISVKKAKGVLKGKDKVETEGKKSIPVTASAQADAARRDEQFQEIRLLFEQTFSGNDSPKRPVLNWYKNDREILSLIEMRCSEDTANQLGTYLTELDGSSTTTMARSYAAKVDAILKELKASCNFTLESESMAEARKKLRFTIEF